MLLVMYKVDACMLMADACSTVTYVGLVSVASNGRIKVLSVADIRRGRGPRLQDSGAI